MQITRAFPVLIAAVLVWAMIPGAAVADGDEVFFPFRMDAQPTASEMLEMRFKGEAIQLAEEGKAADLDYRRKMQGKNRRNQGTDVLTPQANTEFLEQLRADYDKFLIFETEYAEREVSTYDIQCPHPDGRVVNLRNLLYVKLQQINSMGGIILKQRIDSRGEIIRITDVAYHLKTGEEIYSSPVFEINAWGELQLFGITRSAVLATCDGIRGPIWEIL